MKLRALITIFCLFFSSASAAYFDFGLNLGYLSDSNNVSANKTDQKTFYELYALTQLKSSPFHIGLAYMSFASAQPLTATTSEQMSAANLYIMTTVHFGRGQLGSLNVYFNPSIQGNYIVTGRAADLWTGSGMAAELLVHPNITEMLRVNAGVLYYSETYSSKSSTSASSSVSSIAHTTVMTILGLQYGF